MKISENVIALIACALIVIALALASVLWGVPSEPTACDVGPMEASQCRAEGRPVSRALRMWEVR